MHQTTEGACNITCLKYKFHSHVLLTTLSLNEPIYKVYRELILPPSLEEIPALLLPLRRRLFYRLSVSKYAQKLLNGVA